MDQWWQWLAMVLVFGAPLLALYVGWHIAFVAAVALRRRLRERARGTDAAQPGTRP